MFKLNFGRDTEYSEFQRAFIQYLQVNAGIVSELIPWPPPSIPSTIQCSLSSVLSTPSSPNYWVCSSAHVSCSLCLFWADEYDNTVNLKILRMKNIHFCAEYVPWQRPSRVRFEIPNSFGPAMRKIGLCSGKLLQWLELGTSPTVRTEDTTSRDAVLTNNVLCGIQQPELIV